MTIPHIDNNDDEEDKVNSGSDDNDEEQQEMKAKFHKEWEKKRKNKSSKENDTNMLLTTDHYAVLGLEDLTLAATEGQIKGAYRKLALQYHPDKHKRDGKTLEQFEENELTVDEKVRKEIWLKIQSAYETLADPEKRKKYDGSLPFDESIPSEDIITDENFYDIFDEVFKRNATWAKKKPVPNIGGPKTSYKNVEKFYRYWNNFESIRDFSCHDEYDLEEAADKYEKKYMLLENRKVRKKYMTKERGRINELYRVAYRNDPRIKAEKRRIEVEKERKQQEREEKKRKQLEKELKEKELLMKKKQEEEMVKKRIEIEKQVKKQIKEKFRDLADLKLKPFDKNYDRYWAEEFEKKLTDDEIRTFVELFDAMEDTQESFDKIVTILTKAKQKAEQRIKDRQKKDKDKREEQKSKKKWTKEDYALIAKALNKFPGGTQDRWKTIASFMGDGYTPKDAIELAKSLAQKGKTAVKGTQEKIIKSNGAADEVVKTETDEPEWTDKEQKLLEQALKKYPKDLPPKERWTKISEAVPGKTPKQCLARFKYIASLLKKKNDK